MVKTRDSHESTKSNTFLLECYLSRQQQCILADFLLPTTSCLLCVRAVSSRVGRMLVHSVEKGEVEVGLASGRGSLVQGAKLGMKEEPQVPCRRLPEPHAVIILHCDQSASQCLAGDNQVLFSSQLAHLGADLV